MPPNDLKSPEREGQTEEQRPHQALIPYTYAYSNDEIDLVDVGANLWRRWKLMAVVFLACFAAGLLIAFLVPRSYAYSTMVQIGTQIVQNQLLPIEPPASAAKKVQNGFLPEIVQQYAMQHGFDPRRLKFQVDSPDNTDLVIISGKGPQTFEAAYHLLEKTAADKLVKSELPMAQVAKARLESELADQLANLRGLTDPKYKALLQKQIATLQTFLGNVQKQQMQLNQDATSPGGSMRALLMENQVQQAEQNLGNLQITLSVDLPNNIKSARTKVNSLQTELGNLQMPHVVSGPMTSLEPVGLPRFVVAILGAVVGLMLALMAGAFMNYLGAVRKRLASSENLQR